jgi:hypothetical protein
MGCRMGSGGTPVVYALPSVTDRDKGPARSRKGESVDLHDELIHKTPMVNDIPYFDFTIGCTVAARTLKSDVLAHLDRHGYTTVAPQIIDDSIQWRHSSR